MQTITDNLKNSLSRNTPVYKKTVNLYRRYWNGSTYVYATVEDITDEVVDIGNILWKLDIEGYAEWKLDNVTLTFRNDRNQWKQGNLKGHWTGDYILNQSRIIILVGAQLADGTYETIKQFSGYISGDSIFNPENKTVEITLISAGSILANSDAAEISNLITDEEVGQRAGTVFETAYKGVGKIIEVKRGRIGHGPSLATTLIAKKEYTISNLDDKDARATITLTDDLSHSFSGDDALWVTYRYWYTEKEINWIIQQFLDDLGLTGYTIEDTVFSETVKIYNDLKSTYLLKFGTKSNTDIYTTDGKIRLGIPVFDDFSDDEHTSNPTWVGDGGGAVDEYIKVIDKVLVISDALPIATQTISAASSQYTGTWELNYKFSDAPNSSFYFRFISSVNTIAAGNGYTLLINPADSGTIEFHRNDGPATATLLKNYTSSDILSNDWNTFRITRDGSGNFNIYLNESLIISATDTTHNSSSYLQMKTSGGSQRKTYINYIGATSTVLASGNYLSTGTYNSNIFDCTAGITSFDILKYESTKPANTSITIETYSSGSSDFSSDNDPAGWVAIGSDGAIGSAVKRYFQFRVVLTTTDSAATPDVSEIIFYYFSKQIRFDLVVLSGFSYLSAIAEYAKLCNYEFGFSSDNKFFYRARTVSSSVLDIKSDTNLIRMENFNDGIDRIYNVVIATVGDYEETATAENDAEPNSVTKYGTRIFSADSTLVIPDNLDISRALAPTILVYTKSPRRRLRLRTQFLPQLELGDKVTVYIKEQTALRQWKWGDTDVVYGQADLEYYDDTILEARLNFWNVEMRVEGIEINIQNWFTILNLVEVI